MGRTEKSQGLAPPAVRKDIRAKQARHVVNKVIPAILASNARARKAAEESELIVDPGPITLVEQNLDTRDKDEPQYVKRKGQGRRKAKAGEEVVVREGHENKNKSKRRKDSLEHGSSGPSMPSAASARIPNRPKSPRTVRIITTDVLTAAHMLSKKSETGAKSNRKSVQNVCVLNMASPLRPGGGVLTGATSQEEFLCSRTTLLPSLKENFYRLPEFGGIYSHDVLVFHNITPLGDGNGELGPGERYWIDVISAGMLRFPELEGQDEDGKGGFLGKKDVEMVENKMRGVLRIASLRGVKKIVLGAWGCGAYGNPVADIARAWKRVLNGALLKKSKSVEEVETWDGIEEVVFAITNIRMAHDFAKDFGGKIDVEAGPSEREDNDEDNDEEDKVSEELRNKIIELEKQLSQVWNPDLKARMSAIVDGLRLQLKERDSPSDEDSDDGVELQEYSSGASGDRHRAEEGMKEGNDSGEDGGSADGIEAYEAESYDKDDESDQGGWSQSGAK